MLVSETGANPAKIIGIKVIPCVFPIFLLCLQLHVDLFCHTLPFHMWAHSGKILIIWEVIEVYCLLLPVLWSISCGILTGNTSKYITLPILSPKNIQPYLSHLIVRWGAFYFFAKGHLDIYNIIHRLCSTVNLKDVLCFES